MYAGSHERIGAAFAQLSTRVRLPVLVDAKQREHECLEMGDSHRQTLLPGEQESPFSAKPRSGIAVTPSSTSHGRGWRGPWNIRMRLSRPSSLRSATSVPCMTSVSS